MNCQICGTELPPGAMFCGECGSAAGATVESRRRGEPGDTSIVRPIRPRTSGIISVPFDTSPPLNAPEALPGVAGAGPQHPVAPLAVSVPTWGDAPAPATTPNVIVQADESAQPSVGTTPALTPAPVSAVFVFTVNTGQLVTVTGGGLLGRRPFPQPGESYDQLVQIIDLTMSVSKNHFEFGQIAGEDGEAALWVNDRFSGNGTVLSRPGQGAERLEPGRRYLVPRGSRLDIGELYVIVG